MDSFMTAQKTATQRNALSELLVDFAFQRFAYGLANEGIISNVLIQRQKEFVRDDCSDVYDHFLSFDFLNERGKQFEIWAQTTCYKGNDTGAPESNKTYEIRETITEAISLRKWLMDEKKSFRTIHITLGPQNYTYGWFGTAKASAFDLSIYPRYNGENDLFDALMEIGRSTKFEYEIYDAFEQEVKNQTDIGSFIVSLVESIRQWFQEGMPQCELANKQASLLHINEVGVDMTAVIRASKNSGEDIKGRVCAFLDGGENIDSAMVETLKRVNVSNPFLPVAAEALIDWTTWSKGVFSIKPEDHNSVEEYIRRLWSEESDIRYIIRRLLMRAYSAGALNYVQDVNIPGITEHNLYNGKHSTAQITNIVSYLIPKYFGNGYTTCTDLYQRLISAESKSLVNASRKFEKINGTSIKPSFIYLEEYLRDDFLFVNFNQTTLPKPIAYYSAFSSDTVRPYDNLKVILRRSDNKPIAIVKAKFFRKPEFPRRVKEEAYLGLSMKYAYDNEDGEFSLRYSLPMLMFIDMQKNYAPPEFAIRRLVEYGWLPFFKLSEIHDYLLGVE